MYHNCPKCNNPTIADVLGDNMSESQAFEFECNKCGTTFVVEIDITNVRIEEPAV